METKNEIAFEAKESWSKPELLVMSIAENTLGGGAAGIDFGSEISG